MQSAFLAQVRHGLSADQFLKAIRDIADGWRRRDLWGTIGLHDIRQRYRRSVLGPFWITISMGIMIAALGVLYGAIFQQPLDIYLPYLAAGFIVWNLISGLILEGSQAFISAEHVMRQLAAPSSIYCYRVIWSNVISFLHNIWIFAIVAIWFGSPIKWTIFWAIPALALLLINGLWLGLLLGLLSARFRDVPLIVSSVVQVMFFITPVIWRPDMLPDRAMILDFNPFYHLLEIVRAPMLGYAPSLEHWAAALVVTVFGWLAALFFYTVYRWRIVYWV